MFDPHVGDLVSPRWTLEVPIYKSAEYSSPYDGRVGFANRHAVFLVVDRSDEVFSNTMCVSNGSLTGWTGIYDWWKL